MTALALKAATGPLTMIQMPICGRRLFAFARDQGLRDADPGYVVHALLAALFGTDAPQPFALPPDCEGFGRGDPAPLSVLAYSRHPIEALREKAQALALPSLYQAIHWDGAGGKPMPALFPQGLTLGFEVRACPVVRIGRGNGHLAPGSEVDAVVAAHLAAEKGRRPVPESREAVYRAWLTDRLAEQGATVPRDVQVVAMRLTRLFRRGAHPRPEDGGARPKARPQRPDVRFRGRLEVADAQAFGQWLARGVGRHRAFGFGMVLLRPA